MLTRKTAAQLKESGLDWIPNKHDFFMVPDTALEDQLFALSDMTVALEVLHGHQAITFNGAVEWALDYVYKMDALWIPTESQLRDAILDRLAPDAGFSLQNQNGRYLFVLQNGSGESHFHFEHSSAEEAYAAGLLSLLQA